MKLGFVLSYTAFSPTNGIRSQAISWKKGLEELGHKVVLINMWDTNQWNQYDAIIIFGFSVYSCEFISLLVKVMPKIILAPILDPDYNIAALKIYSHWGSSKLRLSNPFYALRQVKNKISLFLVRSEFEKKYIVEGFGIPDNRVKIIRLSHGVQQTYDISHKENFCLHISLLCDSRKNVKRLIEAAKKYKFRLILAGKLRNAGEEQLLNSWIDGVSNIEYVGYITEKEKYELYCKAKVFALPSLNEGVGIVALEAAAMGCDIVVTSLGGPHEYYNGFAKIVNPYRIDEIGQAIKYYLEGHTMQPELATYIRTNYSLEHIASQLEKIIIEFGK